MLHIRMTTLPLFFLALSPFVLFDLDFLSALYLEYPSEYFDGTLYNCRIGQDDKNDNSAFLSFGVISLCYI